MNDTQEVPNGVTLYTVNEAAEKLRVSRWMINHLIQRNELKSLQIGSRRLIEREDLLDFVKQQKEENYE